MPYPNIFNFRISILQKKYDSVKEKSAIALFQRIVLLLREINRKIDIIMYFMAAFFIFTYIYINMNKYKQHAKQSCFTCATVCTWDWTFPDL